MKKKGKYQAEDFAIIRIPIRTAEEYEEYDLKSFKLDKLINNVVFREAVAGASIDLADSIEKYKKTGKCTLQFVEAINNYNNRSIIRTTPFGMFCGVASVEFSDNTSIIVEEDKKSIQKLCAVDWQWIYKLLQRLESDTNVLKNISIKFNDICYTVGSKVKNPAVNNYGQMFKTKSGSALYTSIINNTNLVRLVKEIASDYVKTKEVIQKIEEYNREITEEKILQFLVDLICAEYLVTDLRPPINECNPLKYIIDKLEEKNLSYENKKMIYDLKDIQRGIEDYNLVEIGKGELIYRELINKMSKIETTSNYISFSLGINLQKNFITRKVKNILEDFSELLEIAVDFSNEADLINDLKIKFIKKYGVNAEVSFLELIDSVQGVGNPFGGKYLAENTNKEIGKEKYLQMMDYIKEKREYALRNGNEEIEIKKEEIEKIANKYESKIDFSYSFELNIFLKKVNSNEDNYLIYVAPNIGSYKAGDSSNRFSQVLGGEIRNQFNRLSNEEMEYCEDCLIVNLCEILRNGHANNICVGDVHYLYSINLSVPNNSGNTNLALQDIYVGYDSVKDRLYLKSKKYNKKIRVISDNMLNPLVNSNIGTVLLLISKAYFLNPIDFLVQLKNMDVMYMPRIRFGKVILQEQTWKLKSNFFDLSRKDKFFSEFELWIKGVNLPRYIYVVDHDKRLRMDSSKIEFAERVYKELRRKSKVVFEACEYENIGELIARGTKGNSFFSEMVVPFTLKDKRRKKEKEFDILTNKKSYISFVSRKRNIYFGDNNWLYFKIYLDKMRVNEFIGEYVYKLITKLNKKIKIWFFIRYSDPEYHIRLRICAKDKDAWYDILEEYFCWYRDIMQNGISYKYVIDVYSREIERYGNLETIELAEQFFCMDSNYVMETYNKNKRENIEKRGDEICLEGCYILLKKCNLSDEEIEHLIENGSSKEIGKKFFSKKPIEFEKILHNEKEILYPNTYLNGRSEEIVKFIKKVESEIEEGKSYNSKADIILSLLHMFCNRFNGDRYWELKILSILSYGLHRKNGMKKHYIDRIDIHEKK